MEGFGIGVFAFFIFFLYPRLAAIFQLTSCITFMNVRIIVIIFLGCIQK